MTALRDAVLHIAPHCSPVYLAGLEATDFAASGISASPMRMSQFLGQFLGETGGGVVLQESGNYTHASRIMAIFGVGRHSAAVTQAEAERIVAMPMPAREKAIFERVYGSGNPHKMAELGNRPGDGWPFRGTGPLQSTGRGAAKRWGDKLGIAVGADQLWMLEPKVVFAPSIFEWTAGNLNAFADRGDLRHIRRVINGGYNGLADCEEWQAKAWAALRDPANDNHPEKLWAAVQPDPSVSSIQNSLNLIGYTPKLTLDGRYGPATKKAVAWFQEIAGVRADGIAGPVTMTALNLRFATKRAA